MEQMPEMAVNGLQLQPPVQGTEKLYGWYPPAYSPYSKPNYKQLGSYDEEARFRHQATLFHNPPGDSNQQESSVFHRPPTIMSHRSGSCVRSADISHRSGAALSAKMDGIRQELLRRQMETPLFKRLTPERQVTAAAASNVFNYQSEKSRRTQRPVFSAVPHGWCPRYPEPDLRRCWSPAQSGESSRASVASSMSLPSPQIPSQHPKLLASGVDRPASPLPVETNCTERHLESAASQRPTGRPKTAPALLRRQTPQPPQAPQQQGGANITAAAGPTPQQRIPTSYQRQVAAMASVVPPATELMAPKTEEEEEADEEEEEKAAVPAETGPAVEELLEDGRELTVSDILDDPYDKALKVHGWRMEVHGDPLGLKSRVLQKRLPIAVKIPEPNVLPQPPRMVKENKETFFQRTLPNGALSFDIHPDFPSERFNAKRQELQRKGQWNYAIRDFSFVY